MKRILIIVLAVVTALAALGAGTLWWNGRALGTPVAVEFADAPVSDRLASATVLALGEATHGTHEFQAARLTLLQKVVDRGFTTIAWEEDFGSIARVNAWLQGGPGAAEDAVAQFGYRLNKTTANRDLLVWIRAYNDARPAGEKIRLVGVDAARPTDTKALALSWLASRDAAAAADLDARLAELSDDTLFDRDVATRVEGATAALLAAVTASDDGSEAAADAAQAARVLEQSRRRAFETGSRDALLFENLRWGVERGAASGREHTLLFAHNGHVDRAGQASLAPGDKLGELAARHWGESYRAIGTDGHRVAIEADGVKVITVSGRHRGLFGGSRVGYLEVADVTGPDADLLRSRVTMVSVGFPFAAWQAWIPFLHTVDVTPTEAWDALIYVGDAAPTTRLP